MHWAWGQYKQLTCKECLPCPLHNCGIGFFEAVSFLEVDAKSFVDRQPKYEMKGHTYGKRL